MYTVALGVPEACRQEAAELYWEAFGRKLGPAIGPRERGIALLAPKLELDNAMAALSEGQLLGLAGFQLEGKTLVNLTLGDVFREFGPLRGVWRSALLALLDRKPAKSELLLDGIVVRPDQRGRGIGTALLQALFELARANNLTSLRLDVVDTNPRARSLYEREGFVVTKVERTPYLRRLMGFGSSAEMVARPDALR